MRSWDFRRKDRCGMKTEGVRKLWDRYKYAALILLVGAGLLLWPAGSGATAQTGQNEASQVYAAAENLQAEMEEILALPLPLPRRLEQLTELALKKGGRDNITIVAMVFFDA